MLCRLLHSSSEQRAKTTGHQRNTSKLAMTSLYRHKQHKRMMLLLSKNPEMEAPSIACSKQNKSLTEKKRGPDLKKMSKYSCLLDAVHL